MSNVFLGNIDYYKFEIDKNDFVGGSKQTRAQRVPIYPRHPSNKFLKIWNMESISYESMQWHLLYLFKT